MVSYRKSTGLNLRIVIVYLCFPILSALENVIYKTHYSNCWLGYRERQNALACVCIVAQDTNSYKYSTFREIYASC